MLFRLFWHKSCKFFLWMESEGTLRGKLQRLGFKDQWNTTFLYIKLLVYSAFQLKGLHFPIPKEDMVQVFENLEEQRYKLGSTILRTLQLTETTTHLKAFQSRSPENEYAKVVSALTLLTYCEKTHPCLTYQFMGLAFSLFRYVTISVYFICYKLKSCTPCRLLS